MSEGRAKDGPGKMKDGFNLLSREMDRAFTIARFMPFQMILIEQARRTKILRGRSRVDRRDGTSVDIDWVTFRTRVAQLPYVYDGKD